MTRKTASQLDREITEALASKKPRSKTASREHALFYLSEALQGGKYAEHIERFDSLEDALRMLARLPEGSITYGTAKEGPKFMVVWAAPAYTNLLYWTDGDLNAQPTEQDTTREIRIRQAPAGERSAPVSALRYLDATEYFAKIFSRAVAEAKKRGDH